MCVTVRSFTYSLLHGKLNMSPLIPICVLLNSRICPYRQQRSGESQSGGSTLPWPSYPGEVNNFNQVHSSCGSLSVCAAIFHGTPNVYARRSNELIFWELWVFLKRLLKSVEISYKDRISGFSSLEFEEDMIWDRVLKWGCYVLLILHS